MKDDPLIESDQYPVFAVYLDRVKASKENPQELFSICDALQIELQYFYWLALREKIMNATRVPRNKKEILALAMTFVAEAELQGFNRSFIYHKTQTFFFNESSQPQEITSEQRLE